MKVYKFYKDDCAPCRVLSSILANLDHTADLIPVDVKTEDGMRLAKSNAVSSVPTMLREDGIKLVGVQGKERILSFLNGGIL